MIVNRHHHDEPSISATEQKRVPFGVSEDDLLRSAFL